MRRTLLFFVLLTVALLLAATATYRHLQTDPAAAMQAAGRVLVVLTDADKALIASRDSTSKWLLGLAFALLPGLVIQKKGAEDVVAEHRLLPLTAGACIIASLYGFLLAQDSVDFILSRGPQYHLYGMLARFPLLVQFWFLIAALMLLLVHWFGLGERIKWPALFVAMGVLLPYSPGARAADSPSVASGRNVEDCVSAWAGDRGVSLQPGEVRLASSVTEGLAKRARLPLPPSCEYVASALDQARWLSFLDERKESPETFRKLLSSLNDELTQPKLGAGEFLQNLLKAADIWRAPSGLLSLKCQVSSTLVLLNAREIGLTNLDLRLAPASYSVEFWKDGKAVSKKAVKVDTGRTVVLECRAP